VVTDACVDLQVDQVAPGSLEEPENRLIGEGRRVGEVDGYLNVVEDCVDTNARDRVDARVRRGCPGNGRESRLNGGNVKALVDEAGSRGGLGYSGEHGRPSPYFTMMVPVMSGCMEQWYATVPAVLKVWV
jgi:hypothetical protein